VHLAFPRSCCPKKLETAVVDDLCRRATRDSTAHRASESQNKQGAGRIGSDGLDELFCYDPAVTANGPFQLKAGPESRQKNTNCSPMRTITSRFPGLPEVTLNHPDCFKPSGFLPEANWTEPRHERIVVVAPIMRQASRCHRREELEVPFVAEAALDQNRHPANAAERKWRPVAFRQGHDRRYDCRLRFKSWHNNR
jgi:hypothetical protein